ncbi:cdc42 effector protein 4a [Sparus aurata]|uniref:cdc42 effector protein 4a n=1 Tax=Sparus aurata TaxID=8175 RepID=UPI0011C14AF0|nr:cdc42 effector protein 4-like [Sparus aurata]XP_030264439.1 cdc42 effector protein 4-like [Sparus aurata]XP_030264440.1 cdc42 effector protein 4-like [Sparus aurata]
MPILKQLVSGSQTKRRSRMDLTREMISAPLGDFRHTMHVGRSGDAFGDTSFLSTRSGEPPEATSYPSSPRPGLLSRTFRSSKRSQSVTRVDQQRDNSLLAPGGSPTYVKNAMSLPFLNDGDGDSMVAKSLSSSPLKQQEVDGRGAAAATHFLELEERSFGELTELPETSHHHHYGGGMKHAESVMSFHVDLGPSMLGEILGVMEKEDDDLGYEEGKSSEGRASPPLSTHGEEEEDGEERDKDEEAEEQMEAKDEEEDEEEEEDLQPHAGSSIDLGPEHGGPYTPEYTPETRPKHLQHLDSCSMSSSGSAALDEKPSSQTYAGDTDSATFSAPPEEESNFSSFLEDEDDEIRV